MTPEKRAHIRTWMERNLRRGCTPLSLRDQLKADGFTKPEIDDFMRSVFDPSVPVDYERLCRVGLTERAETNPDIRRLPTSKAQVYSWTNFLTGAECDRLVALINDQKRPSTVTDAFADKYVRTSETSDLGSLADPFVYRIDNKIAQGIGLHWSYADGNQGQKYSVGQEFKAHHDYFEPNSPDYKIFCQHRGQRTWTFMIYLNDTPAGGGTRFRKLEKTFYPTKGMAVIWNNLLPDGRVNPYTLHHGMKVREGEKYVITKWFRELGWGPMFIKEDDLLGRDLCNV